ncbi:hypothetical protein TKK_0008442 [Trichogramma kaykai]
MESNSDVVRVKQESNDTWSNADEDHIFDLVNLCKAKNFETSPLNKSLTKHINEAIILHENLDEKIFIDFECKDNNVDNYY